MNDSLIRRSKFLSLILRHDPGAVGITLDANGWVEVDVLLAAIQKQRAGFSRVVLDEVVATNEKKRYVFSEDGRRIRAAQGHLIGVDLGLEPVGPPEELFHGTAERNLESIRERGLVRGARDFVHLSADAGTARKVGMRHGMPAVLIVKAAEMAESGHFFYLSENGVWLTEKVPPVFLK